MKEQKHAKKESTVPSVSAATEGAGDADGPEAGAASVDAADDEPMGVVDLAEEEVAVDPVLEKMC
jgi:hypothetical protein